ncbi:carbohydrate ABC transporter permease [Paenibacillus hodogayensis]|uniref:Carbohydrate ABC transporter permease n=1 Tax=Paenibacillus hodogayensis TaxID=279208 RepID=A0ABV5VVL0_9BACL
MQKQGYWGYIFTLPFLIHVVVFVAFPILFSTYLSFAQWDLFNPIEWVGLRNWKNLLSEHTFWISIRNVFYFALIFVPLQTILSLIVAHLLNQAIRGKTLFRLLYFLPVVTPWMAGGMLWNYLYGEQYGLVNWVLSLVNLGPVQWLTSRQWWIVIGSIAFVQVWKGIGSSMILLLAGMQNISKEMHEAAQIDGASGFKYFSKIVLPLVSPMIYLVMILSTISAFQAFDVFLAMWGANVTMVPERNLVPNMLIYRDAFMLSKMGPASAAAWALFLIILTITLFQRLFEKRWVHYD